MFSLKKEIATHWNTSFRLEYFIRNFACSSWCIHQCQGCRTNKRSVYANPSTYIFCLHMRGLFDLTGWHASALRIGFMACSLPGNRPYSTTILLGHARFSTDTNDFSRNSPRPEGKKKQRQCHSIMPAALSNVSLHETWQRKTTCRCSKRVFTLHIPGKGNLRPSDPAFGRKNKLQIFLNERLAFPRNSNARRILTRDVRIKIIQQGETRCF